MGILLITNVVTYLFLLSKNEELKSVVTERKNNKYELAEALAEHVYYDGDSIPRNQIVKHYNRSGKNTGSKNLVDLLSGDKVVMLLSPNCCSACAKGEINTRWLSLLSRFGFLARRAGFFDSRKA